MHSARNSVFWLTCDWWWGKLQVQPRLARGTISQKRAGRALISFEPTVHRFATSRCVIAQWFISNCQCLCNPGEGPLPLPLRDALAYGKRDRVFFNLSWDDLWFRLDKSPVGTKSSWRGTWWPPSSCLKYLFIRSTSQISNICRSFDLNFEPFKPMVRDPHVILVTLRVLW